MKDRLRIVVLGYIVKGPLAGFTWHHLQYVLGLDRLGHDVVFIEDSGDSPWCCYDPSRHTTDADPSYGLRYAASAFQAVGLADRWAYHDHHTSRWLGPLAESAVATCEAADLLIHLGQSNPLRSWLGEVPVRALIDTDPAFTQIRHLTEPDRRARALEHNVFFTFGENFGREECAIPDDGLPWQATRQPVVLDAWPVTAGPSGGPFTTVLQWDSYAAREHEGRHYGMKSQSFGPYLDLPTRSSERFELALAGASAPGARLVEKGWAVSSALEHSRDLGSYQRFVRGSKGEWSVAKHGYVASWSGWFSERSTAYLASGRPVVVEDTGCSAWLDQGAGVITFRSPEEALAGIEEVSARYPLHCRAARAVAEEYFDSRAVLSRLVDLAMAGRSDAPTAATPPRRDDSPRAGT